MKDGHDVAWARTHCPGYEGCCDPGTRGRRRQIITYVDKDFWQIGIQRQSPLQHSGVIVFRVHPAIPENITPVVLRTMASCQEWRSHASTVTADRVLAVRLGRFKETLIDASPIDTGA